MKSPHSKVSRAGALMLVEACVALALAGMVLAMVSLLMTQYARSTDYFLNYRRVQLAAESQIERLRAGLLPLEDAAFTDDAGISYRISVTDADAAWAPLRHVRVTATVTAKHNRRVRYELSAYVGGEKDLPGGAP